MMVIGSSVHHNDLPHATKPRHLIFLAFFQPMTILLDDTISNDVKEKAFFSCNAEFNYIF